MAKNEEDYDICETCGWEEDPFMSVFDMKVQFIDCEGNKISPPEGLGLGTCASSPNHCNSVNDGREAWSKYKTWGHFDKDNAPEPWALVRHEAIKKRGFEDRKEITKEETDQIFKKVFGKNYKEK